MKTILRNAVLCSLLHLLCSTAICWSATYYVDADDANSSNGASETFFIGDPGTITDNDEPLYIGADNYTSAPTYFRSFHGFIDDLRITKSIVAKEDLYYWQSKDPQVCGDRNTVYPTFDTTGPGGVADCKVNLFDFAAFASDWLSCTDPAGCP